MSKCCKVLLTALAPSTIISSPGQQFYSLAQHSLDQALLSHLANCLMTVCQNFLEANQKSVSIVSMNSPHSKFCLGLCWSYSLFNLLALLLLRESPRLNKPEGLTSLAWLFLSLLLSTTLFPGCCHDRQQKPSDHSSWQLPLGALNIALLDLMIPNLPLMMQEILPEVVVEHTGASARCSWLSLMDKGLATWC